MGVPMLVISADGVDVEPVQTNEILMGMAETYDIIFTVPEHKNYELRATAQDATGFASSWIGMGEKVKAPVKPRPNLYASMGNMKHMNHGQMSGMEHTSKPILDTLTVDALTALKSTELPQDAKIHELKLVLGGNMERYVWHINGKAISEDRLIIINKGEIVRFIFHNDTMMHHPMHLHGHFFRVLNDSGKKSPLKHTVDVPPHGTRTIEFYANEPGQWMLHCHNLYHMKTGMARVVRYSDFKLTSEMQQNDEHDPHLHEHLYTYSNVEAGSNHAKGQFKLLRTQDELDFQIESANVDGKNFAFKNSWATEGNAFYRKWFSNFFNVTGGSDFYGGKAYGYILPLLIHSKVFVNHEGKVRMDLEKRFQWTKSIFSDADLTLRPKWGGKRDSEFEVSLMYGPSWNWAAGFMLTEKSFGVSAQAQF
jgi:hypothetical protein